MKVCLLAPVPPPAGGIAGWTKRMLEAKLENGWEVVVVDEQVIGGRTNFGETAKPRLHVEIKRCFHIWKDLWKKLYDADIKIVQSCVPAGIGSLLREIVCLHITHIRGRRFIIHFRCTTPNMVKSRLNILLYRYIVNRSDDVFLLNKQSLDFTRKQCKKANCRVIPNFINTDEIIYREKVSEKIKTAVYVGGVIPEKGCLAIIDAAKILPQINFKLIGKIGISEGTIPNNVVLCGELDRQMVKEELRHADVFLFLSHFWGEGFSNALAEAMAAALPCIVTDWAANRDMIQEQGGIVLESIAADKVAEAFYSIASPAIRLKMGKWNQHKARSTYSQEVVTRQYIEAYEELVKNEDSLFH